jgi:hypothetical protein
MRDYDDFDDDREGFDDEAFFGTLIWLAQRQLDLLFDHRVQHLPGVDDRAFLPLLHVILEPLEEYLSPAQLEELWVHACATYHEQRTAVDPKIKFKQSEQQMQQCVPGWLKWVAPPQGSKHLKKNGRRRGANPG